MVFSRSKQSARNSTKCIVPVAMSLLLSLIFIDRIHATEEDEVACEICLFRSNYYSGMLVEMTIAANGFTIADLKNNSYTKFKAQKGKIVFSARYATVPDSSYYRIDLETSKSYFLRLTPNIWTGAIEFTSLETEEGFALLREAGSTAVEPKAKTLLLSMSRLDPNTVDLEKDTKRNEKKWLSLDAFAGWALSFGLWYDTIVPFSSLKGANVGGMHYGGSVLYHVADPFLQVGGEISYLPVIQLFAKDKTTGASGDLKISVLPTLAVIRILEVVDVGIGISFPVVEANWSGENAWTISPSGCMTLMLNCGFSYRPNQYMVVVLNFKQYILMAFDDMMHSLVSIRMGDHQESISDFGIILRFSF